MPLIGRDFMVHPDPTCFSTRLHHIRSRPWSERSEASGSCVSTSEWTTSQAAEVKSGTLTSTTGTRHATHFSSKTIGPTPSGMLVLRVSPRSPHTPVCLFAPRMDVYE